MINKIISLCPKFVDLTNTDHLELMEKIVDKSLNEFNTLQKIEKIEKDLINRNDISLTFVLLALKIAKSKIIINDINDPVTISVVFAVYKEHNRIKKSSEHPHGEDFLRRKVSQLEWLFKDHPNFNWKLIVVDDGCPENSGKIALDIVNKNKLNNQVKVLFLKDAIDQNLPITKSISSTSDSQKGGAIIYGMWYASQQNKEENHIIIYTDADLSTHLGQTGLLIEPILKQKKSVAIGSRREKNSIVVKKATRNDRGKLFIYLWKRLIPNLEKIIDTQCGYKAFKNEIITRILDNLIENKFAFDIELLVKAELVEHDSIAKVAIAWIDSEEASTTTDLQPYLPMLKSIAKMYKKYLPLNKTSSDFALFISKLNEEDFNNILNNIPEGILKREPYEYTDYDEITVADLIKCKS